MLLLQNDMPTQSIYDSHGPWPKGPVEGPRAVPHVFSPRWKRPFDCVLAILLLLLSAPIFLLAAVLVKVTSRGPVFYTQRRVGQHGRIYNIYKFRTMFHNCERATGPRWCTRGDSRITPLGRILRPLHIDELPQLWNILRGEMSLVGPRPERPEFVAELESLLPCYRKRLQVRPGLTGLAQLQLPPDTDLESVRRKLACDLYYIHRTSLLLELRIVLGTGLHVAHIPFRITRKLLQVPTGKFVQWFLETLEAHALNLLDVVQGDEAVAELAIAAPLTSSVAMSSVQPARSAVAARLDIALCSEAAT
jgi:lipopolysaccharide/colanic/teichoic acid biosynthesis glycosyltransferase